MGLSQMIKVLQYLFEGGYILVEIRSKVMRMPPQMIGPPMFGSIGKTHANPSRVPAVQFRLLIRVWEEKAACGKVDGDAWIAAFMSARKASSSWPSSKQ